MKRVFKRHDADDCRAAPKFLTRKTPTDPTIRQRGPLDVQKSSLKAGVVKWKTISFEIISQGPSSAETTEKRRTIKKPSKDVRIQASKDDWDKLKGRYPEKPKKKYYGVSSQRFKFALNRSHYISLIAKEKQGSAE
ncbi:hypothetical protein CEXT_761601 [Caerostris extrusa]|uniref:Uncharacterized protein n=1 Tax=Caerostris extrusa TaxID=172846 RepID=A0AAV4UI50_CAEEX|nr:hypothetical protein CEXT_761601 [Caerostris extrusa]